MISHQMVTADGREPERLLVGLHGVFGMGSNLRSLAKLLVREAPEWGVVLPDLRAHGASQGEVGPHTLASAAEDVEALSRTFAQPIGGAFGHSFGGKVLLTLLQRGRLPVPRAALLDSNPGARAMHRDGETALRVLSLLRACPSPLPSREAFAEYLRAAGEPQGVIEWLSMNVRLDGGLYRLRLDLDAIEAMLTDYFERDMWSVLLRYEGELRAVVGGRSSVFGPEAMARLKHCAEENPRLSVTTLPEAGHWVHVDDPVGVARALGPMLGG